VNDNLQHALALSKLLHNLPARVNLIKYHTLPGGTFPASNPDNMIAFRDFLTNKGLIATLRASRGEDILAACGMLSGSLF
jgi:23S rRNA (adenine2503-C2)-methyltransferase